MDPCPASVGDDLESGLPSRGRRTTPIPAATLAALINVHEVAKQADASGNRQALRAALERLFEDLPAWPIGWRFAPSVYDLEGGRLSVLLTLDKPRREGPTERILDVEAILVLLAHCVAGGRIDLEPHGPGSFYYFRLTLPEDELGVSFRAFVIRLIVGTPTGKLTKEHHNFRDLRRKNLGKLREDTGQSRVWLGVEQAKRATLRLLAQRIASRPSSLPPGLDIETARTMLDDAYTLLNAVPLGQGEAE